MNWKPIRWLIGRYGLNSLLLGLCLLAALATVAMISLNPAEAALQLQDNQRKTDMQNLQTALRSYAADHDGHYPQAASQAGYYSCYNCGWSEAAIDAASGQSFDRNSWIPDLVSQGYISALPIDPLGGPAPGCS